METRLLVIAATFALAAMYGCNDSVSANEEQAVEPPSSSSYEPMSSSTVIEYLCIPTGVVYYSLDEWTVNCAIPSSSSVVRSSSSSGNHKGYYCSYDKKYYQTKTSLEQNCVNRNICKNNKEFIAIRDNCFAQITSGCAYVAAGHSSFCENSKSECVSKAVEESGCTP